MRPWSAEAQKLAAQGVREITLLGQNVNAYHGEGASGSVNLAGLVAELSRIPGIERLRYTTSHPRDMTDDLIAAHAENPKLMPYLHLPVQSGSDRILKAMNRGHTSADYLRLVERIRAARPDIAMSGDFIVGFPGETEDDFRATLELVREVGYAFAYSFKYSPRPGTPAADAGDQVPAEVAQDRLHRLQALLHAQQTAFNASLVGRTVPVLLEKPGKRAGPACRPFTLPPGRPRRRRGGPYRDGHEHPYLRCWNQQPFGPLCPCSLMILEKRSIESACHCGPAVERQERLPGRKTSDILTIAFDDNRAAVAAVRRA